MKRLTYSWCLCITIALAQFGCTSQLLIERTLPAEVSVTEKQWKVVVLNRYNTDLLPYNREKKVEVYADGAIHALAGVLVAIQEDLTYSLVNTDTAGYISTGSGTDLTPVQVQEIYRKYPHHLLLTLDNFDTFFEQEVVRQEDEDGGVFKTVHYTLFAKTGWALYDSTGTVPDRVTLAQNEHYNSRGVISGLLAIGPAISKAGPVVNSLAWETGWQYWQRLTPQQVSFVRLYYSNKAFAPAASQMASSNWKEAIALLKPLTEDKRRKMAARAAYNLAVVYEAMNQILEAKHWATIASQKKEKLALLLLTDLDRY